MDIYISKYEGEYGGGMALVAATSEQEALTLAFKHNDGHYDFSEYDENWNLVPAYGDGLTKFEKLEGASFDCSEPKVIAIDIYIE